MLPTRRAIGASLISSWRGRAPGRRAARPAPVPLPVAARHVPRHRRGGGRRLAVAAQPVHGLFHVLHVDRGSPARGESALRARRPDPAPHLQPHRPARVVRAARACAGGGRGVTARRLLRHRRATVLGGGLLPALRGLLCQAGVPADLLRHVRLTLPGACSGIADGQAARWPSPRWPPAPSSCSSSCPSPDRPADDVHGGARQLRKPVLSGGGGLPARHRARPYDHAEARAARARHPALGDKVRFVAAHPPPPCEPWATSCEQRALEFNLVRYPPELFPPGRLGDWLERWSGSSTPRSHGSTSSPRWSWSAQRSAGSVAFPAWAGLLPAPRTSSS